MGKSQTKTSELKVAAANDTPSYVVGSFFNGMQIPQDSLFELYQHKHDSHRYVLHGENSTLEYNGDSGEARDSNDYVVALYDPKSKSVELFKAPMIQSHVTSLEHRVHKGPRVKLRGQMNYIQRNALGEAFGTKKAKAAIVNLQKNKIDADKLQDVEMDIIDNVAEITAIMPSREQMLLEGSVDRPIPQANENATAVEDIFPLDAIIPKAERTAIRVNALMEEESADTRLELMPYAKSAFVAKNLDKFVSLGNTKRLQMLYYASLLFGVYNNRRVRDKTTLMEKLGNKPAEVLVDGVLERFAVAKRTSSSFAKSKDRSFVIDPFHEDKLLCHLLALLFHLNGFLLELLPLAHELNMKPTRITGLFRAMGATIKPVGVGLALELGLSKKDAATYKVAVLKVPFKLPEMLRKGARK
ncbi:RNA polymerase I associated factor, A49-like protein [Metschnikowia bicuspidata var. bicuspidata NRRL YB-4993]|uniref:RNA polymerase I associated factor, A49-like protein n=1 Tax=Metschnikowia bicuspidata var. bicuspidata NRRL YB-4993 TaxID=869754 RepID=A0A1A0HAJ6_9ASCO|nr:RNA polymerase I associated factor, A49-like protein [Metschnikowia bicuspidata var. bicuspidata NRRL YB-4993]OBA21025.1 RNA polymerase I associated factor, A49-like protein [Metschnikowia bicuspidata var. bicuspidata NRRL YB-4993]